MSGYWYTLGIMEEEAHTYAIVLKSFLKMTPLEDALQKVGLVGLTG